MRDEASIEGKYIDSLGRAASKDSDLEAYDRIDKAAQQSLSNQYKETEIGIKQNDTTRKEQADVEHNKREIQKLRLKAEELRLKDKAIEAGKFTSIINKN